MKKLMIFVALVVSIFCSTTFADVTVKIVEVSSQPNNDVWIRTNNPTYTFISMKKDVFSQEILDRNYGLFLTALVHGYNVNISGSLIQVSGTNYDVPHTTRIHLTNIQ